MSMATDGYKGINCTAGANYFQDGASSWRMAMFTIMYASIVRGPVTVAGKHEVTLIDWSKRCLVRSVAYKMDDRISIIRKG